MLERMKYRDAELLDYMIEREGIRRRRAAGEYWPWTDDPILRQYPFCNIDREHDRTTIWIRENWREPHADDPHLWFAMMVARLLNSTDTLQALGYPVPWDPERWTTVLHARKDAGKVIWGSAYQIGTGSKKADSKIDFLRDVVLTPNWDRRDRITAQLRGASLAEAADLIMGLPGFAGTGFMAAQVIADLKHTRVLRKAQGWWTWAHSGPGSVRGLNLVLGRPFKAAWNEREWHRELLALIKRLDPELEAAGLPELCAQNWQNNLCEISKYWGIQTGEVRPKRIYHPPTPRSSLF